MVRPAHHAFCQQKPGAAVLSLSRGHFKTYFQGHLESTHVVWKAQESPPFSKGGQGGLIKRLIIPLNPPLRKGDFKPPFPALPRLSRFLEHSPGFAIAASVVYQLYFTKIIPLINEVIVGAVREPPLQRPPGMNPGICKIHPGHDTRLNKVFQIPRPGTRPHGTGAGRREFWPCRPGPDAPGWSARLPSGLSPGPAKKRSR